jgi:UDP-glucose 4-epimerase
MKHILVTGGAGYIGSHTILELLEKGYQVTAVDSLVNSSAVSLQRVAKLTGMSVALHTFDVRDREQLEQLFASNSFDAVIHFAGLKAVGESVAVPLHYYGNNLTSTLVLCEVMQKHGVKQLIFSSSATVYGDPATVPITEDMPIQPTNPYGQTKAMIEQILRDLSVTKDGWQISLLRYFNPVGAHVSGQIGEDPNGKPNNLLPYIAQVAVGSLPEVAVFGDDYDTPDGTGIRDYIHVVDVAAGHVAALKHMPEAGSYAVYNLATGKGTSVLEAIQAFKEASGKPIPYTVVARRPGDIAACYADPTKAERELDWRATKTFAEACADAWRWQSQNPRGYN